MEKRIDTKNMVDDFIQTCKQNKLKVTPQRLMLYKKLLTMNIHPSAEELHTSVIDEFPTISFDTVHRTLLLFAKLGLLDIVEGKGSPRRYDPNLKHHHHLHCIHCNTIIDFYSTMFDNLELPGEIHEKHTVLSKKVVVNIVCNECKNKVQQRDMRR